MKLFLANILILILALASPDRLLAATAVSGDNGSGLDQTATNGACTTDLQGNVICPETKDNSVEGFCASVIKPNSITGNIIRCVEKVVRSAGDKLLLRYTLLFANIIFYAVMIAIMMHGVKMMYGVANMQGVTFTTIAKILVVLYFSTPQGVWQIRQWRDAIIDFPKTIGVQILAAVDPDHSKDIIPGVLNYGTLLTDFEVNVGGALGTNLGDELLLYPAVYDKLDTQIMKFFGMDCGDKSAAGVDPDPDTDCTPGDTETSNVDRQKKNNQLYIGIAALVVGLFATGPLGAQVSMVAIIYSTSVIFAVAEVVLFFILITVAINFLAAIAPLAIACILFERTHGIFKVWLSYVLSYLVQPIFLVAFLAMILAIVGNISPEMQNFYKKVRLKWQNDSASPNMETTLYNCLGHKLSSSDIANRMSGGSIAMNNMMNGSVSNHRASLSVDGTAQDDDYCGAFAKIIKIDRVKTGVDPTDDQLTQEDVDSSTARNLAITILMVLLISFMKHIPQIMDRIVGQGLSGTSLMGIASAPGDFTLKTIEKAGTKVSQFVKRGM